MSDIVGFDPEPTGPWWKRLVEALRIFIENVKVRRQELADDADWYEDIDRLAEKKKQEQDADR